MPKKSETTSPSFGYDSWSRRRTIDEAKNIARWSPWTAHEWMAESIPVSYTHLRAHET